MQEKEFDYINVIPLVDVMLVLLTIVLTTSTFIATGVIPVQLPKASSIDEHTLKTLMIEIDEFKQIYLNSKVVSLQDLKKAMNEISRDTPILIRSDKDIALQVFVDVLDVVKGLGFKKVSLQTEERR